MRHHNFQSGCEGNRQPKSFLRGYRQMEAPMALQPNSISDLLHCRSQQRRSGDHVPRGKAAKVKCTNTAEFTVENGKAKVLACQEDDAGISRVASSNYGSWVNNKLTETNSIVRRSPVRQSFRPGRSLYRPLDSGGSNSATLITESEAITVISGDAESSWTPRNFRE